MPASKKPEELRNIQIRLSPDDALRVQRDISLFQETAVVAVRPGAYAKAALLAYPRFRRMEATLRALVHDGKTIRILAINDLLEAP